MIDLFGTSPAPIVNCLRCGLTRLPGHICAVMARAKDPETSFEAARKLERSGEAQRQRDLVLNSVRLRPGSTAAEIADYAGMERHQPSRRLPELEQAGLVRRGEARACKVTSTPHKVSRQTTWWATGEGK